MIADVAICGAGIAGIATAYFLSVVHGIRNVVLVDERPMLSLTSDKSTECYRNWWPGPDDAMVALMNRSIDLLEQLSNQSDNVFRMNRRGYAYGTADPQGVALLEAAARESAALGSGDLRLHDGRPDAPCYQPSRAEGWSSELNGADLITDQRLIREHFGCFPEQTLAVLHARRCGWLSAQQLGMYLWSMARQHGARLIEGRVSNVLVKGSQVYGVKIQSESVESVVQTSIFVDAAGPFVKQVAALLGVELPVFCEPHIKIAFEDRLGVVPRDAPLLIWNDPTPLVWSDAERAELDESPDTRVLLKPFPPGVHARPDGGGDSPIVLVLWSYDAVPIEPCFPLPVEPEYPEIALRGLATALPELRRYLERPPRPFLDGGYYTKTAENRPLIGPLPVEGAYVIGALSGYGIMASCAAAELLAAHITGSSLPSYAAAFSLTRYDDPAYQRLLQSWNVSGQL